MKSVVNAIKVVEELATGGDNGVGELARRTGIPKSTVQRCLDTLHAQDWIERVPGDDPRVPTTWRLSSRLAMLAGGDDTEAFVTLARPFIERLRDESEESVHLAALEGADIVLLERVPGPGAIQIVLPLGHRVPAYAAATGKAILACLDDTELAAHLPDRLDALTASTITSRRTLLRELSAVRARGWATNVGEWERSVVAVAAAVVVDGRPRAAVSVSTTPDRLPPERLDAVGRQVVATADAIAGAARNRSRRS
ncbi:MAG: IclR family transcriptional regulator [Acidimicrobiales bacterium]